MPFFIFLIIQMILLSVKLWRTRRKILAQQFFEVPSGLQDGCVLEWIPRQMRSQGNGLLKFYDRLGYELSVQEIKNGCPADLFDFLALAQNLANEQNLSVDCPTTFSPDQIPRIPVRCVFISKARAAL